MQKERIGEELTSVAFDFFYWFSRFEFALKENGYLKNHTDGALAMPGWEDFVARWESDFHPSTESNDLLNVSPKTQIVVSGNLTWKDVGMTDCKTELRKVVRLLKTVRNNLFHGGKHGGEAWDDPIKTKQLLTSGKAVLDQLAAMAGIEPDYTQYY